MTVAKGPLKAPMPIRRAASLIALACLSACAGGQSDGGSTFHLGFPPISLPFLRSGSDGLLQKEAEAGKPVLLWGDTSLGDTCVPVGETKLEVETPPAHGTTRIEPGRLYAVYPEGDPHAPCSGRLVTGMLAYYTADQAFAGADQVVLRAVTADGAVQRVTVNLTVSPPIVRTRVPRRVPSPPTPDPAPSIAKPTIRDPDAPAPTVLRTPYPGG
jgi:hypothetical protein